MTTQQLQQLERIQFNALEGLCYKNSIRMSIIEKICEIAGASGEIIITSNYNGIKFFPNNFNQPKLNSNPYKLEAIGELTPQEEKEYIFEFFCFFAQNQRIPTKKLLIETI